MSERRRVVAVLVAERARPAGRRVGDRGRVPGRVALAVRADHREAVVQRGRAGVVGGRHPRARGRGHRGGRRRQHARAARRPWTGAGRGVGCRRRRARRPARERRGGGQRGATGARRHAHDDRAAVALARRACGRGSGPRRARRLRAV